MKYTNPALNCICGKKCIGSRLLKYCFPLHPTSSTSFFNGTEEHDLQDAMLTFVKDPDTQERIYCSPTENLPEFLGIYIKHTSEKSKCKLF